MQEEETKEVESMLNIGHSPTFGSLTSSMTFGAVNCVLCFMNFYPPGYMAQGFLLCSTERYPNMA